MSADSEAIWKTVVQGSIELTNRNTPHLQCHEPSEGVRKDWRIKLNGDGEHTSRPAELSSAQACHHHKLIGSNLHCGSHQIDGCIPIDPLWGSKIQYVVFCGPNGLHYLHTSASTLTPVPYTVNTAEQPDKGSTSQKAACLDNSAIQIN
jgi:hypothetical protein